jgi:hypothetical protein
MILSMVLSARGFSGYKLPIEPILIAVAIVILFVEAVLVWRISTRGGRKATV